MGALLESLAPEDPVQAALCERIVAAFVRIDRIDRIDRYEAKANDHDAEVLLGDRLVSLRVLEEL